MAAPAAVAARPGWPQPQQQASEPTPSTSGDGGGDASAAAGGLVELQSSTGRLRRGLRVVCVQCRDTRRRCDGGFPCSRCYDMCLPCRPVLERRPRGGGGGEGKPRRRQPLQQRVRYEEAAAAAAYPLLDLALSRTHPLPLVEGLLQVFAACHREQPLDRGCAVRLV